MLYCIDVPKLVLEIQSVIAITRLRYYQQRFSLLFCR